MDYSIIAVKGVFNGIYEWGRGFVSNDVAERWKRYWLSIDPSWWKFIPPEVIGHAGYLACHAGIIYLHPMGFNALLSTTTKVTTFRDGTEYTASFSTDLEKLLELCRGAAEACGGTFEMIVSPEKPLHLDPTVKYTQEEDYFNGIALPASFTR